MRFSEYRRLRKEEEQDTGATSGALSMSEQKSSTGRKFTDIMKEREPQKYASMVAERNERKANNVSDYLDKVNSHLNNTYKQTSDAASYINQHKDTYTPDAGDYVTSRHGEYDQTKQQAFALMKEAWDNQDLDKDTRKQALDLLLNSVANVHQTDKTNTAFADYMNQFDNKDAFDRTRAAERKQEEAESMTVEELQRKIEETNSMLEKVEEEKKQAEANNLLKRKGIYNIWTSEGLVKPSDVTKEDVDTLDYQKKTYENDIQNYKNMIFQKEQQKALNSLTDKTKDAFEKLYALQTEGYNKDSSGLERVLDNLSDTSPQVQRAYEREEKEKAISALEEQGISSDEFESLYEYYKFARDSESNKSKVKEWNSDYENAGTLAKIGMNLGTIASAPVKGVTAAQEMVDSLHYKNDYAPLNTNSANYEFTNYVDTVRNATSQDIDNKVVNFLYQTGMSMADFGVLLPLNAVTGNAASLAIMGTNAGTSAAKEATLRGVSKEQALMTGLAAGTAEIVFEKMSLDNFWDIARKQGRAATRNAFLNIAAQAGIEGSEEFFTDIANTFTDNLINKGLSEWYQNMDSYYKQGMTMTEAQKRATYDYCMQLKDSFLGGALSGGLFGTGAVINTSLSGKQSTMVNEDFKQVAEGIDTDRSSYASQEDYEKAMEVQQLSQSLATKDKVTNFEKGLFNQVASELSNIDWNEQNNPNEQIRQISSSISNETVSRAFVADYKEGMPVDTYTRAFSLFYGAGYTDMPFKTALEKANNFTAFIDEPTLYAIHSLGQNQAEEMSKQYASAEQKELVNTMANALGVKVEYQDIPGANGMYKDGVIYISNKTINPSMVVMSHELTHELKETANEEYMAYENYVIDYFKEFHEKDYEALYSSMTEHYGNDEALIREEIAANAAETFLTDSEAVSRFVKENRTVAERISDFLSNFVNKLKELYQNYTARGKAGKMLSEDIEVYEKARDLWYEAVKASEGENNTSENSTNSEKKLSLKEYDSWDKKNPRVKFHVSNVSEPLISVGIDENREITFDSKKIIKIKSEHPEMTDDIIKNIDTIIKEPIAIMNSATVSGRITMIGELEGDNGNPVIIALELHPKNSKGIEIEEIKICTAYTKDNLYKWLKNQDFLWINPDKNKTNAWLKRTRVQFPVGINQYGLIKSIPQNQKNNNVKFSLKEPIEETKNLIALHNLTSDKFMKTLDLGGFPMPSIAITNTDIGHSNFGDISCVFYKDTIDPANKKNKVFGADAWTPTFPKVEYEANLDVARNVHDIVSEYAEKLPEAYKNNARSFVSGLEYSINSWGGYEGIIEEALRNTSMKAAYLVSKGEKVEEIIKTTVSELEPQNKKTCEMLLKAYGDKADKLDGHESGKVLYEALGEETKEVLIQNAVNRGDTEENARAFLNKFNKFQIASSIRNALKYRENKGIETTTVIDTESMRKDIENRVDMNDYKEWLEKLFKGIEKNSGLWNGKEPYTASGNRRSFKQTHIPFNVQNIVEAMLKQSDDVRNVAGFNGTKTIRAVVTEDFKSISAIKNAAKTKLMNIDTDEYNALRDKLDERLNKVIRDIVDAKQISDNIMIDMDNVGEIIIEACKNPTADNFKNTLNKYSRICTDEQAKEIADIVETVANMPVNMFEAKPLRVVDFSEVAAVILPKGTSKELIQKITDNGMRIMEYEAGNESERQEVLNSIRDVKFSLKSYADDIGLRFSDKEGGDLFEEIMMGTDNIDYNSVLVNDGSEAYRATMDLINESAKILQDGIKAAGSLKDINVTKDMAHAMATHYLDKYSATFNEDTLADNLYNIFAYIQKSENVDYQDMIRVMQEVCKPVIATSQKIDKDMLKQYNDFRKIVKSYPLKLNEEQKAEIASVYDSFRTFKNVNQNKYTFRDSGNYLDNVWSELVEASGYALSYDTPSSEQMLALHNYMTSLEKSVVSPSEDMDNSQVAYDMALNIYTDYFKLIGEDKQAINNLRTQMQKKITEYKHDIREDYKDRFKKYKEEAELQKQDEINRLQKQIRKLEHERDDARYEADDIAVNLLDGNIEALQYKIGKISKRNAENLAKLNVNNYNRSIQRAMSKQETEIKNHIKKNMFDLQNRLAKPKDNKYIPQGLVRSTIDLCEAVNINTGKSERLAERLDDMSRLYARLKEDKDYAIASEYDENTQKMIDRLREVFKGRNITMLNMQELKEVDGLITQLRFQIVNAGKLIGMEKSKEVYDTAVRCMQEIDASEGYKDTKSGRLTNKYITTSLNAKRQFRRMAGYKNDSVMEQLYEDLDKGQLRQTQTLMEAARLFDPVLEGEHNQKAVRKMLGKDRNDWIDSGLVYKDQSPVIMPRSFLISLAMQIQNKSYLDHIIYGGLTVPEWDAYMRGDYTTAYTQGTTIRFMPDAKLSFEQRQQLYDEAVKKLKSAVSNMTVYDKEFKQICDKFFHEFTTEKVNEVSLQLNGYKKAVVKNYFPIKTDKNFTHAEIASLFYNSTIEGSSFLNSRTGARNPVLLEDVTQVIQRVSKSTARYYGMAIPVRNFKKIYNVTLLGYQGSTKQVIAKKWGVEGQKFIEKLLTDIESGSSNDSSKLFNKLQGNFAAATLTLNPSVTIKQAASYPTAAYTVGWDALGKAFKYVFTKSDLDTIAKYTPLLWYRNQGNSTQELADAKQSDIIGKVKDKLPYQFQNAPDTMLNWIQKMDTKTVATLWKACEFNVMDTQKNLKQGSEEFYQAVAKVFNQCVEDTQPNYTTLQRPDILRNQNTFLKSIFMFKTQPMQNFGILYDATMNLRAKENNYKNASEKERQALKADVEQARKDFARAVSSQLVAGVVFSAMTLAANALLHRMDRYRDDDDEITIKSLAEMLMSDTLSCLSGALIGGSEIYNVIYSVITQEKYYGISSPTLEMVGDLFNDFVKLTNDIADEDKKGVAKFARTTSIASDILTICGIPINNAGKIVNGIKLHIEEFFDDESGYFNTGFESTKAVQYRKLFNYLAEGDNASYQKQYEKTLQSLMYTKEQDEAEATIKSEIKSNIKDAYLDGTISYDKTITLLNELGDEEAYFTVKKWDNADDKEYSKYSELEAAVLSGIGIDEEIKELTDNGVSLKNVNQNLKDAIKQAYKNGDITREKAIRYLLAYKDDFTEDDAYWQLREWDKEDSYADDEKYSKYDDLINAVDSSNFDSVVKEYLEHGLDAKEIKQQISNYYKPLYQEAYLNKDYKKVNDIKVMLNKIRVNGRHIYASPDYLSWNEDAKKKAAEKKD